MQPLITIYKKFEITCLPHSNSITNWKKPVDCSKLHMFIYIYIYIYIYKWTERVRKRDKQTGSNTIYYYLDLST